MESKQNAIPIPRSSHDDPQPGDCVQVKNGKGLRRVVMRDLQRVAYVESRGPGSIQWCRLLAWQLWCDSTT